MAMALRMANRSMTHNHRMLQPAANKYRVVKINWPETTARAQ